MPTLGELARLRLKSGEAGSGAPFADVYDYIDNSGNAAYAHAPNIQAGGEQSWGSTGPGMAYADPAANGGSDGNQAQAPVTFDPRDAYEGIIQLIANSANGEGSGGYSYRVDGQKLPTTRFGDVNATARVSDDDLDDVIDPRYVYEDPNFGRITHATNLDRTSISDMIFPAIMAAAMGGMGALAAPGLAGIGFKLPGLAQAFSNGGTPWSSVLGMLGPQLGIPSWLTSLGGLAAGGLDRRGGG